MEPATREEIAEQRGGGAGVDPAGARAAQLDRRALQQSFADIVAGKRERVAARERARGAGASSVNSRSSMPGVEGELAGEAVARHVGIQLGRDRDRRILELQINGERVLLRDVERLERERLLGGAQRAVEVAQLAEREAEIVVGGGERRIGVDRAAERGARVGVAAELHEHEADPVPSRRAVRRALKRLAVGVERRLQRAAVQLEQAEIEPGGGRRPGARKRAPERLGGGIAFAPVCPQHAEIVPGEPVLRIEQHGPLIALRRPPRAGRPDAGTRRARSRAWAGRNSP